jgi:hypothetical protein
MKQFEAKGPTTSVLTIIYPSNKYYIVTLYTLQVKPLHWEGKLLPYKAKYAVGYQESDSDRTSSRQSGYG